MEIFIKALQLVLSLSILVLIHEFGHFIAARIFKTRVEKFYLFFNPWFSLFKFKHKGTEYGLGWLPLGGYVKISGMIDESMDKEQMKLPPQPHEFRSKKSWQRLIIMVGGVFMNLVLAVFIYIFMLWLWGEEYLPNKSLKYGITVDSIGYEMGLRNGDFILSLDNKEIDNFRDIPKGIIIDQAKTIQIKRDGKDTTIKVPEKFTAKLLNQKNIDFISYRFPFEVGGFPKESNAQKAGLKVDDKIIGINDSLLPFFNEFRAALRNYKNKDINVMVLRNSDTLAIPVKVAETGTIGVFPKDLTHFFELKKHEYSFLQAIPAGTVRTFESLSLYVKQFRLLFQPETKAYEHVGGFITIGNIFPPVWDWQAFWSLTALLSIILAFMNLLPIPALDGGHVLFLLYEIVTRRKPNEKFMEYAQIAGMIILFALLIYANGNDILKLFK